MACAQPQTAYYGRTLNESGKRSIVFNRSDRYLGSDLKYINPLQVPCGKCLGCKADQALMWSIRAYHESTLHKQNCFVTLTYDDKNLPTDNKINKRELQLFFKRLRKQIEPTKLRYIACGEYGDATRRPHYHAIIFGLDFLHDKITITDELYSSPTLLDAWQLGHVTVAPVTMSSICYVCGYVMKKMNDEDTFNLMSRRPGIGHDWLKKFKSDLTRTGIVTIEGREYAIPPRYILWDEEDFAPIKAERKKFAKEASKKFDPVEKRRRSDNKERNRRSLIQQKKETL